jgi:acetyl esterase/lipase
LSGVYEIRGSEAVFGKDPEGQKQASPIAYARAGVPPFLITYCQWDYPTLPAQAKKFHAALRKAGAAAALVYVPRENHISEIVNVAKPGDVTAQAVLEFVGKL